MIVTRARMRNENKHILVKISEFWSRLQDYYSTYLSQLNNTLYLYTCIIVLLANITCTCTEHEKNKRRCSIYSLNEEEKNARCVIMISPAS